MQELAVAQRVRYPPLVTSGQLRRIYATHIHNFNLILEIMKRKATRF